MNSMRQENSCAGATFSLVSVFCLRILSCHSNMLAERISTVVYTFVGHALGMSLVTLDFPRVMYRNVVCYGNLRKYDAPIEHS